MIEKPKSGEYHPFYETYVSKVPDEDLVGFLEDQAETLPQWFESLADKADYRYGEGKWTVAEVLHHCCDAERVFAYRAFAIARGEKQALPGMDQDDYMAEACTAGRSYESLVEELRAVRAATLSLVRPMTPEIGAYEGTASGNSITVRALLAIIGGHLAHHVQVLKERYL